MMQTKGRKKCILAVDDAAIVLTRIADTLHNDFDVFTVNSGVRALKFLEQIKPDLILLDIQMAHKNGIETLREIRAMKNRADIPVIMLTGVEDKDFVLESAKLGICDYILKPFYSEDLIKRICRVFEKEEEDSKKREEEDLESIIPQDPRFDSLALASAFFPTVQKDSICLFIF